MRSEIETKRLKIVLLASGLMLCIAVLPALPAGFYAVLRVMVCGVAIYASLILSGDNARRVHPMVLALLATLFNPLIPVQLSYSLWLVIDLGTAVYFLTLTKKL